MSNGRTVLNYRSDYAASQKAETAGHLRPQLRGDHPQISQIHAAGFPFSVFSQQKALQGEEVCSLQGDRVVVSPVAADFAGIV
jgi:hypothetical protein